MAKLNDTFPMGTLLGDPLPGAPELAARGETTVGVRTIELINSEGINVKGELKDGAYPAGPRPLKVEVWYPACPSGEDCQAVYTDYLGRTDLGNLTPYPIQGRAWRDAAPDAARGPAPVVVISHGYPGSRILLVNLAENLASKGYVVLSIGHTDNTYEDFLAEGSLESAVINRSLDQRFVIGQLPRLAKEGFLRGMLQPDNVGLIGFSMGGYGALRTIGSRLSGQAQQMFEKFAENLKEPADYHGVKSVRAAVLFAPAVFWSDPERTADMDLPTLWICGTADRVVGYAQVRGLWEKTTASERILVSYEGCGHNVANNPAPVEAQAASWEIFKRWADPVWDTWKLNNLNCHFVTAFLDSILKGDADKEKYLQVPVTHGRDAIGGKDGPGTRWPGFVEGGEAGITLERMKAGQIAGQEG